MRFGWSVVLMALLAAPAGADDQMLTTPAAPAEPLYEATRPAPVANGKASGSENAIRPGQNAPGNEQGAARENGAVR